MPELPDVEGFRRRLERHARGRRIGEVEVLDAGVVRNTDAAHLARTLAGRRVSQPERRGKWLLCPACQPPPS
jgi:formamidopyrimidine-DNA glycosylase